MSETVSAPLPVGFPFGQGVDRDGIHRDAWVAGEHEQYRYTLTRVWGPGPLVFWILANPSVADGKRDDQTCRVGMAFSRRWGFGGMVFANEGALRSTDPKNFIVGLAMGMDVVGPQNDDVLRYLAYNLRFVVCAWGDCLGEWGLRRGREIRTMLLEMGIVPCCLGLTKKGNPRHPLKLAYTTKLEEWKDG